MGKNYTADDVSWAENELELHNLTTYTTAQALSNEEKAFILRAFEKVRDTSFVNDADRTDYICRLFGALAVGMRLTPPSDVASEWELVTPPHIQPPLYRNVRDHGIFSMDAGAHFFHMGSRASSYADHPSEKLSKKSSESKES